MPVPTFQSTPPTRGATDFICQNGKLFKFQSTPPTRGATSDAYPGPSGRCNFNPRPPHGGRLERRRCHHSGKAISIHAPHTGGDQLLWESVKNFRNFNPRPPHGGRPFGGADTAGLGDISIHAPHTGGDGKVAAAQTAWEEFQSTPPTRGATAKIAK